MELQDSPYIVDCNSLEDLREKIWNISGVYFCKSCRQKSFWSDRMIDPVTEKIQNMDSRFFWDKKHNNLNFEGDKLVYPFGLDENDRKPGYFAYVTTCFPLINNANRFDQDRFIPLHVSNTIEQGEDVVFTDHALERLPLSRNTVRDIVAEERGEHYHDTKGRPGIRRILYQHSIIVVNYSETPPVVITGYPAPVPHKFRNNARFQLRTDSDTR